MILDEIKIGIDEDHYTRESASCFWFYTPHLKGFLTRTELMDFINRIQQVLDEDEKVKSQNSSLQ